LTTIVGRYINCQILSYLQRYFFDPPNRAADPVQITILDRTFPHIEHYWSGSRTENWYLDLLAVHPDAQGKGCGRELVQWGIDQAKKDGVVASVISAKGKEGFYGKFGYVEVGRANVGPMSEAGIQGGAIMFTGTEEE
jgi:GNAT superfamily N-acetyltransferase